MKSDQARSREPGRGRAADKPSDIPVRGWKDVLLRTFKEVGEDRVTLIAGGVTYFLLLAIFPAIAATFSIYGLVADSSTVQDTVSVLTGVLPSGGVALIEEQLVRLTDQGAPTLGTALLISLALALWSASSGVKALFEAMNVAYDETEKRGFLKLNALALGFTLAGIVGAAVMLIVVIGLPVVLGFLGLGTITEVLLQAVSYLVMIALLMAGLAALYRYGPSRQEAKWRWITPGALLAVVVIATVSGLFSWYAANFANYEKTYGSMGGLIGFLFWMWVCINVVIVGAELNAELEHQTARDSTAGQTHPMGRRDATMADTVGASSSEGRVDSQSPDSPHAIPSRVVGHSRRFHKPRVPLIAAIPAVLYLSYARKRAQHRS